MELFCKTDILVPSEGTDFAKWSVIACDQHTSEPEYWDGLSDYIGGAPSTLRMMLPEAWLSRAGSSTEDIHSAMRKYLSEDIFRTVSNSYIYLERTLSNGKIRRGLIGGINLKANLLSTEGIVEDRLPARIAIRKSAPLEMPHALVFAEEDVFSTVVKGELLYDFDLNMNGGHIRGWQADADCSIIRSLAIADGNHSIAAAKRCGDDYALAELLNIYDDAVEFYPIHRVLLGTDTSDLPSKIMSCDSVEAAEQFCRDYVRDHGGTIDYIHNNDTAVRLGVLQGNAAVLLPAISKADFFDRIRRDGPFPKKSFSIGLANDKRYYLECRKIND